MLDYPDEDIEDFGLASYEGVLRNDAKALHSLLNTYGQGRILRQGVAAAIVGKPNVGKSSLLNALAGYDRVIVTDIPGTTRDTVEESVMLGSTRLRLIDTAGIRETADTVEAIGVARSKKAMEDAEIERLEHTHVSPAEANALLESIGETPLKSGASLADLLRRPPVSYSQLAQIDPQRPELPNAVKLTVEVQIKYAGYANRQMSEVERHRKLEEKHLPPDLNYQSIRGLRLEAAQKLSKIQPRTVGQASRISGVNPADISVLLIYLGMK